jgi:hypothetical protein
VGQNSTGQVLSEIAFDKPGYPRLPGVVFALQSRPCLQVILNHRIEDRALRPFRAIDRVLCAFFACQPAGQLANMLASQREQFLTAPRGQTQVMITKDAITNEWSDILSDQVSLPYAQTLKAFHETKTLAGKTIFPHPKNVFFCVQLDGTQKGQGYHHRPRSLRNAGSCAWTCFFCEPGYLPFAEISKKHLCGAAE